MKKLLLLCFFWIGAFGQPEKINFDTKLDLVTSRSTGKVAVYGTGEKPDIVLLSSDDLIKMDILFYDNTIYGITLKANGEIDYAKSGLLPTNDIHDASVKQTNDTQVINGLKSQKFEISIPGQEMTMLAWIATDYKFSNTFFLNPMCGHDMHTKCKGLIMKMEATMEGAPNMTVLETTPEEVASKTIIVDAKQLEKIKVGKIMYPKAEFDTAPAPEDTDSNGKSSPNIQSPEKAKK